MSSKISIPKFSSEKPYDRYKIEIKAWSKTTTVEKKKQGLAVALSLPEDDISNIRDKVFNEVSLESLEVDDGVDVLLKYLDKQFARDDLTVIYEKYTEFDRCKRKSGQNINDFVLEFEQKYNACAKKSSTKISPVILAMKLIDRSSLTAMERKLVLSGIDYTQTDKLFELAKTSLRKFIGEQASSHSDVGNLSAVKVETFISENEEALMASGWSKQSNNLQGRGRGNFSGNANRGNQFNNSQYPNNSNTQFRRPFVKRCFICNSTAHLKADCPKYRGNSSNDDVMLYSGNSKDELALLARDAWDSVILDSACSSTVCGKKWLDEFLLGMDTVSRSKVVECKSEKMFYFGGGERLKSLKSVVIPCTLAGIPVRITTDVVESSIPLLLSLKAMKAANVIWDFSRQEATILGRKVTLSTTSCGHHCIPIRHVEVNIEKCFMVDDNRTENPIKTLRKLHLQFAHPPKDSFISLLKDAGKWCMEYNDIIDKLYNDCETCEVFQRTPDMPVVAMPKAKSFCELVVMDLKVWKKLYILHCIDAFSRLSVSVVIKRKTPQVVAHNFLVKWVGAGYGFPQKIKFDCGGEFNNDEIRELGNCVGMEIETTAADSPWMNGLCERNHAITDRCLEKILHENPQTPLDVALAYACNAKNCLQMWNGFSSFQLVFGKNPRLPDVFNATLPELEGKTHSELIAMHLNVLQSAKEAFLKSQACQKIKMALKYRIRAKMEKYETGDKVYFKDEKFSKWQGPGTVIGQDKQVVFVRHGNVYRRVPTCRLKKKNNVIIDNEVDSNDLKHDDITLKRKRVTFEEDSDSESDDDDDDIPVEDDVAEEPLLENEDVTDARTEEMAPEESNSLQNEDEAQVNDEETGEGSGANEYHNQNAESEVLMGDKDNSIVVPDAGMVINFRLADEQDWHQVEVIGRAGKATGKNKFWINVKEGDDSYSVNMENFADYHINEEVNVVMVPRKDHSKPEIIKAKMKELKMWDDLEVYEEVPFVGQPCIGTCWIITPKVIDGEDTYKARLVCRGDQEEINVPTDSPTCSKSVLRIFLMLASSHGYKIKSKDVKSAFLQGKLIARDVFLNPPQERYKAGVVWKLRKTAYGLCDAAKNWYESVVDEMLKRGCEKSKYENALYYYRNDDNKKIHGFSISHVDDFLEAGDDVFTENIIKNVKSTFIIGSESEKEFKYIGVNLSQSEEEILLDQLHYTNDISMHEFSNERQKQKDDKLSDKELKEYRKIVGCLNWVATTSRPDLCFEVVSLSTQFRNATVADMIAANKAVRKVKAHDVKILFPNLMMDEKLKIVLYTDSAYKNLCDGISSCYGYIVFIMDSSNRCSPITWGSKKIQRIVNSTLAAETMALLNGIKDALYVKAILLELIGTLTSLDIVCYVDNKGLVDAVHSTHLVEDKLTRLSIAAIKEHYEKSEITQVNHIAGAYMLADVLTKSGVSPYSLLEVLRTGRIPDTSLVNN